MDLFTAEGLCAVFQYIPNRKVWIDAHFLYSTAAILAT